MSTEISKIGKYMYRPAEYLPYDHESPRVADSVAQMILAADAKFCVEHVGSTAVPGCCGKGVVDLILLYAVGRLVEAHEILDDLGFQQQSGPESLPENRPLRVATVEYLGRDYRVHVHVLEDGCAEASDIVKFRDLLRSNVGLRRAYEMQKRVILSRGICKNTQYSQAKREFIRTALAAAAF
jgi:GrpB-like predicted nucleotidyltransferase (UPF0157 family)